MRSRYQFTTLSWSKDRRANKHLSDPNPCICFSTYILDLRFLSESRTCTHTPTHIYIHVHARNRRNSARVQLERRKEGAEKKVLQASCAHASRESDYRCLKARVDGRKASEAAGVSRHSPAARSGRFTGNVPTREDHKPLYSDIPWHLCSSTSMSAPPRSILSLLLERFPQEEPWYPRFLCTATKGPHSRWNILRYTYHDTCLKTLDASHETCLRVSLPTPILQFFVWRQS